MFRYYNGLKVAGYVFGFKKEENNEFRLTFNVYHFFFSWMYRIRCIRLILIHSVFYNAVFRMRLLLPLCLTFCPWFVFQSMRVRYSTNSRLYVVLLFLDGSRHWLIASVILLHAFWMNTRLTFAILPSFISPFNPTRYTLLMIGILLFLGYLLWFGSIMSWIAWLRLWNWII